MVNLPLQFQRRKVLIDSSAYLALLSQNDRNHSGAVQILKWLADQGFRQYTTNTMLFESHALILSELGIRQASQFLKEIIQGNTTIIRIRSSDEEKAREILFKYTDKAFSYNDAISFTIMERVGIDLAFTFDKDFSQYGLTVLTPELLR